MKTAADHRCGRCPDGGRELLGNGGKAPVGIGLPDEADRCCRAIDGNLRRGLSNGFASRLALFDGGFAADWPASSTTCSAAAAASSPAVPASSAAIAASTAAGCSLAMPSDASVALRRIIAVCRLAVVRRLDRLCLRGYCFEAPCGFRGPRIDGASAGSASASTVPGTRHGCSAAPDSQISSGSAGRRRPRRGRAVSSGGRAFASSVADGSASPTA